MKEIERELSSIEQENKSCILLFSGGIDSTILLFMLKKLGYKVISLTINYNLRNPKEIRACRILSDLAKADKLIEINLDFLKEIKEISNEVSNSLVTEISSELPSYYIPARNMVFISIATYFAEYFDFRFIFTGHVKPDSNLLIDANDDFLEAINNIVRKGSYVGKKGKLKVMFPFSRMDKEELVELALKYEVPVEYTWSCHGIGEVHCGQCRGCLDRKAFMDKYHEKINRR